MEYFGTAEDREFVYLAMELLPRSLEEAVESGAKVMAAAAAAAWSQPSSAGWPASHRGWAADTEKQRLVAELCKGLACLHALPLAHLCLCPSNLLLTVGDRLKIADAGLPRPADVVGKRPPIGTPGDVWSSPEVVAAAGAKLAAPFAADMWSAGCVGVFTLLLATLPPPPNSDRFDRIRPSLWTHLTRTSCAHACMSSVLHLGRWGEGERRPQAGAAGDPPRGLRFRRRNAAPEATPPVHLPA